MLFDMMLQKRDFSSQAMRPAHAKDAIVHAGLVAEDLEPLQLSKDQHLALLNMLLQTRRMRLVMRDGRRTYTLPQ